MDPFTQGIVGTTVAQSGSKRDTLIIASVIGLLAGLAADLDIFIRSSTDPSIISRISSALYTLYYFYTFWCFNMCSLYSIIYSVKEII